MHSRAMQCKLACIWMFLRDAFRHVFRIQILVYSFYYLSAWYSEENKCSICITLDFLPVIAGWYLQTQFSIYLACYRNMYMPIMWFVVIKWKFYIIIWNYKTKLLHKNNPFCDLVVPDMEFRTQYELSIRITNTKYSISTIRVCACMFFFILTICLHTETEFYKQCSSEGSYEHNIDKQSNVIIFHDLIDIKELL